MAPNGPRFWRGRSGLQSQVSIWLGPPAIQSKMTAFFPTPARAPSARFRSKPGKLKPAIPAKLALSALLRLVTTSPSRSAPLNEPKACG